MWVKESNDITKYIPQDGKWHDVQILNNEVWVDGTLRNLVISPFIDKFKVFDRVLNRKETEGLHVEIVTGKNWWKNFINGFCKKIRKALDLAIKATE